MSRCISFMGVCLALFASALTVRGQDQVAPVTVAAPYVPAELAKGDLHLSGSRTMSELAAVWTDGFQFLHPDVTAQLDFQGSETAFENLSDKQAVIGLLSRQLTSAEEEAFAAAHPGLKLLGVTAAYDAIAVVVAPDLPVNALSIPQLKTLFEQHDNAVTWGRVGLEGDWKDVLVTRFSPDENSGARGEFFALVLGAEGKPAHLTAHAWHTQIITDVGQQRGAIGFVSAANARSDQVRTVAIAAEEGAAPVPMTPESIASGRYPLIRPLTLVVVVGDNGVQPPLVAEFLRYVLSRNGQEDVVKDGFQPLGRSQLLEQYDRLGWNQIK
ncbi:MAG: PstS family phosphate ABC transporter substrate-binding protein [Planctomycetaceae bacterium]